MPREKNDKNTNKMKQDMNALIVILQCFPTKDVLGSIVIVETCIMGIGQISLQGNV